MLSALLEDARAPGDMVVVSAINGAAGIGKTTLALHWAHRVADRYPDGQLYVNLRGFDPHNSPMQPAEAIRGFLAAFGVNPAGLPPSSEAQAALYRSILAGRQMLMVLDNALDTDQVRPLLPGSPGCMVVVTSRNRLTGLVATEGAYPVHLNLLTPDEARELLVCHLGAARVAAEPAAVAEIIDRCAGLPLSLGIMAARATDDAHAPLQDLAAELSDIHGRLDALDAGDSMTSVRSVFSWSYNGLPVASARLFRLLGVHPGPHITVPAAASMCRMTPSATHKALNGLARAHLITKHAPGRYAFHDLLRAYAAEQAGVIDTASERVDALRRAAQHYLHTAHSAALVMDPHRSSVDLPQPPADLMIETFTDYDRAMQWFETETPVLLAVIAQANAEGLHTQIWQLAWCLTDFLDRSGNWHDQVAVQLMALSAAERLADQLGQAHSCRGLAHAYTRLGRYAEAEPLYQQAIGAFATVGDRTQQAGVHLNFAWMFELIKCYDKSLAQAQRGLDLYQAADHRVGEARALNAVGWYQTLSGDHHSALRNCENALPLLRELNAPHDEAYTLESIGHAHQRLGNHIEAIRHYEEALAVLTRLDDRYYIATMHIRLGELLQKSGDRAAAREHWHRALSILDALRHQDADQIRSVLHGLERP
jgi:tetratricopeptide (TPR) repeat protein